MRLSRTLLKAVEHQKKRVATSGILEQDHVRLYVRGGTGGAGLRAVGGVGGRGGDVVFVAQSKATLHRLLKLVPDKRLIGNAGLDSRKLMMYGSGGKEMRLRVPQGIVVSSDDGQVLGELNAAGDELVVAEGGVGGGPANNFSPQRPKSRHIHLDVKLIADVGFVGYPNAGKSTLLKALSRANPQISAFPFTTLKPQIGTMEFADLRKMTAADLPGLIEGASRNVGKGHRFLKHVERTRLLLLVVDVSGFQLSQTSPYRGPFETIQLLNRELELYKESLLDKPAALVINKIDLPGADRRTHQLLEMLQSPQEHLDSLPSDIRPRIPLRFRRIFQASALQKTGTAELKDGLRLLIDEIDDELKGIREDIAVIPEFGSKRFI